MVRSLLVCVSLCGGFAGCLEDDPNYIPPDGTESAGSASSTDTTTSTTTGVTCDPPMELCSGNCVDTSTDKGNCGMCGHRCKPAQEQCVDGMCVPK